jgi:hypothetical protein
MSPETNRLLARLAKVQKETEEQRRAFAVRWYSIREQFESLTNFHSDAPGIQDHGRRHLQTSQNVRTD